MTLDTTHPAWTNGVADVLGRIDADHVGTEMHALLTELYPICRSLTGKGVRDTLAVIARHLRIDTTEVPTGTQAFDWTIPKEWNIHDAWIKGPTGETVVSFRDHNLHVVGYSVPVRARLTLEELKSHLFSMPEHPDWIPYRTSYFQPKWGFCLPHRQLERLPEGQYEVCIDSTLEDGSLTYGECYLPGEVADEVLIACHVCHPSLCNDSLSGVVLTTFLGKHLSAVPHRYSYRLLFAPTTVGAVAWLALNERQLSRIAHGLVAVCVGDAGSFTYKKSRQGGAEIDRAVAQALRDTGRPHRTLDFTPYGGDERQFCSPGFNLPVGSLMRSPYGEFDQYHTSADDLDFVRPEALAESLAVYLSVCRVLEGNRRYLNLSPKGEPQLGKRGLYSALSGRFQDRQAELPLLWVLNYSDGQHSLLDIAAQSGLPFDTIERAASLLCQHDLLEPLPR